MVAANTFGRQVVIPLTNKSGGQVIAGDVVVVDTSNNDAFTTTTTAGFTGGVGIAQETIASNASGRVLIAGYAALVNVNASVTRGHFGTTHTVAKQATDAGATRAAGTFCQFLTGGTTPDALMYPPDLGGASLTNPMTTAGDIIVGGASGTPARLAAGTNGYGLQLASGTPAWVAALTGSVANGGTSGDQTTTSNTFGDITGATGTITTGAHRVRCRFTGTIAGPGSGNSFGLDIVIDGGTREGNSFTFGLGEANLSANNDVVMLEYTTAALSAGSHTIKLQWRSQGGGTTTLRQSAGHAMWQWALEELPY